MQLIILLPHTRSSCVNSCCPLSQPMAAYVCLAWACRGYQTLQWHFGIPLSEWLSTWCHFSTLAYTGRKGTAVSTLLTFSTHSPSALTLLSLSADCQKISICCCLCQFVCGWHLLIYALYVPKIVTFVQTVVSKMGKKCWSLMNSSVPLSCTC